MRCWGQHVTAALQNYQGVKGQVDAGALRPLAVTCGTAGRVAAGAAHHRGVGLSGIRGRWLVWLGGNRRKTPPGRLAQLVNSFGRAVEAPEVKAKLALQALYPDAHCGSDFAAYMRRQYDEYARVMRELNIKGE